MRQWEIDDFPVPNSGNPHPCVIISPTVLAESSKAAAVNLLQCTSAHPGDRPSPGVVRLDNADGLERPTDVLCYAMHYQLKSLVGRKRGQVSLERRRQITAAIKRCFELF